jgi:imidazolonepropionase-like amidohydrolase
MRHRVLPLALFSLSLLAGKCARAEYKPFLIEQGKYKVHMLLHPIGTEEYTLMDQGAGRSILSVTETTSDRGMKRTLASTLESGPLLSPLKLTQTITTASGETSDLTEIKGRSVSIREEDVTRTVTKPPIAFMGFASMPASLQMMMMRYWTAHHRPAHLTILRASSQALPVEIKLVGHDAFATKHGMVRLTRYTVANLMFGREILWMNDHGRLAALMTFAGGLPQEELLDEYTEIGAELVRSGVQQEMLDLDDLDRQAPPIATGAFAIVGARLIDGTGAPAIENSVVVVRDGRIVAAGPAASTPVPAGMRVIHAVGQSLLPGLWEMHAHYSGVEFGPALLSAGITTTRDCGGEFEFLTTLRNKIDHDHALGPRLLLAGLIDSGGPLAFGYVDVKTPAEAVAAVDTYADAHFEQIKVYTQIQPDVLRAITAEAHRRGLSVTGHVPAAINAFDGVADGMDQINHLQFVTRAMRADGAAGPVDLTSERAQRLIALLKQQHIVVDPTAGWGEMAGHPKDADVASFEPGIDAAPYTLASHFRAMGSPAADAAKYHERMESNLKVIRALYDAGVTLIPGSDTGLLGYGLDRELELYVQAGMTPMAAIQAATIVPARVMHLDGESGSVEPGKRADMVLVDGDPLENISNLRRVESVVKDGRLYDSRRLAQSVGFHREAIAMRLARATSTSTTPAAGPAQ